MQIQKKFEGGAVGSRGAEKCSEMGVRVHHIQKFHTLTADRRLSIHVLKGCAAFLLLGEGGATAPRFCRP